MEVANRPYKLSFTAGGLLLAESLVVASEHSKTDDWSATTQRVKEHNLLQARTQSAGNRILREVRARLRTLTAEQLALLERGSRTDQQQLLWLAACKRYELLHGFASEVIRNKFLQLEPTIFPHDFDNYLEAQSIWHPEIEQIAASTRAKLRQVALKMLREAGIVSYDNVIQPAVLSAVFGEVIQSDSVTHFAIFPVSEADIKASLS